MGKFIPLLLILFVSEFLLMFSGCSDKMQKEEKTVIASEETYPLFVKYRSFQNIDSTWGYTIFLNSRPYLHYSRVAYKKEGFATKQEADIVAGYVVKLIQNGDMTPKLSKSIIDSIEIQMKTSRISIRKEK
jgi:hypothetical protein